MSKPHVKEVLTTPSVRTHLSQDRLVPNYTEEEVENLVDKYETTLTSIDKRFEQTDYIHTWTKAEDDFIKASYKYLSDNVIALAINVPARLVRMRRYALGLSKKTMKETYKVVIWAKREDFDEACQKQGLTKIRPDGVD